MHPDDKIARPAKGRYFALTIPEALGLLAEANFAHSTHQKRVDVVFRNPEREHERGLRIVALYRADAVVFYSFEEDFNPGRAVRIMSAAIKQLVFLDRAEVHEQSPRETVSFHAYLGTLGTMTITRRVRTATRAKYRSGGKFSNAFKPSAVRSEEKVIREIVGN